MNGRGFTLIELAIVLLIIAIAAAAVTLRLDGPLMRSRLRDSADRVIQYDAMTRMAARSQDRPWRLVVDPIDRRLSREDPETGQSAATPVCLPKSVSIAELRIGPANVNMHEADILVSRQGMSPTYAVKLQSDNDTHWLLFIGLTGQAIRVNDEDKLQKLLAVGEGDDAR